MKKEMIMKNAACATPFTFHFTSLYAKRKTFCDQSFSDGLLILDSADDIQHRQNKTAQDRSDDRNDAGNTAG